MSSSKYDNDFKKHCDYVIGKSYKELVEYTKKHNIPIFIRSYNGFDICLDEDFDEDFEDYDLKDSLYSKYISGMFAYLKGPVMSTNVIPNNAVVINAVGHAEILFD